MRLAKLIVLAMMLCASPLLAQVHPPPPAPAPEGVIPKVLARESQEMEVIRGYAPLVETYIQKVKILEKDGSWRPDGDHYFIGRAALSKGLDLASLDTRKNDPLHRVVASLTRLFDFGREFLPKGFLQMIFLDNEGLKAANYKFDYVRTEPLGDVSTFVYDVTPTKEGGNGRFAGRIWVEDAAFTIVRFEGSYANPHDSHIKFHFDSWRVNAGPDLWLPAYIYSEEKTEGLAASKVQTFRSQTRLWAYNSGQVRQEQELSQLRVESAAPVIDKSQQDNDLSPYQEQRAWDQQALDNISEKLERIGLLAPAGEIDTIMNAVANNLVVSNRLDFSPEIRCRVLMTSTIESFTMGHTIVLSRGLIDVIPDEATLAAMLAKELSFIILNRKGVDTRYAFYDALRFDEQTTFQHFDFNRKPEVDKAAGAKAVELLKNSPYSDQLETADSFITELHERAHEIPNLISPRLGDERILTLPVVAKTADDPMVGHIVALPLGGRVNLNPWDDSVELLKSRPEGSPSAREKMPFEITPFMVYLTRVPAENLQSPQSDAPPKPAN
jgi:hypothetical protein